MVCVHLKAELEELGEAEARSKVKKFLSTEGSIVSRPVNPFVPSTESKEGIQPCRVCVCKL